MTQSHSLEYALVVQTVQNTAMAWRLRLNRIEESPHEVGHVGVFEEWNRHGATIAEKASAPTAKVPMCGENRAYWD